MCDAGGGSLWFRRVTTSNKNHSKSSYYSFHLGEVEWFSKWFLMMSGGRKHVIFVTIHILHYITLFNPNVFLKRLRGLKWRFFFVFNGSKPTPQPTNGWVFHGVEVNQTPWSLSSQNPWFAIRFNHQHDWLTNHKLIWIPKKKLLFERRMQLKYPWFLVSLVRFRGVF